MEGETLGCSGALEMADGGCLAPAGFHSLAQSSVKASDYSQHVVLMGAFGSCEHSLPEGSYSPSQPPSEVGKWQKVTVPLPPFCKRVNSSGLGGSHVASVHLSRDCIWRFPGIGSNSMASGQGLAAPHHLLGQEQKYCMSVFKQSVLETGLRRIFHQADGSRTSFVERTRGLMMHSPFSFASVLFPH